MIINGSHRRDIQPAPIKLVNLALQGGGAHGAFGWGVIDRLLEDGRIGFESISGTSAGAMNAVVVADGLTEGGTDLARARLESYWRNISLDALSLPIRRTFFDMMLSNWSLDHNPALIMLDLVTRVVSPYQFNPLNINPLRGLNERAVDFERLRRHSNIRLFVSATNVQTGRLRVFTGDEITADVVMASACLPFVFQAIEIDGVPYWDGGYMGNPALYPFYECTSPDVLMVQTIPISRAQTPKTAREILDRVHEISFNASFVKELVNIDFVNRGVRAGTFTTEGLRELHLHAITCGEGFESLAPSSKLNAEWGFLIHLRDLGRAAAARWLDLHFDQIGVESTLDVTALWHDGSGARTAPHNPESADASDERRAADHLR